MVKGHYWAAYGTADWQVVYVSDVGEVYIFGSIQPVCTTKSKLIKFDSNRLERVAA